MIIKSEKQGNGFGYIKELTRIIIAHQGKEYFPVITNPYEMKEKLSKVKFYFDRNNDKKQKVYEG